VIYQKKLNRLYEFVVNSKYRPFAAIYKNISEIIDDPGLAKVKASKLKNKLIERALEEDDPESLRSLLNQVSSLPPLDKTGLDLFALIQDKPLVLNVLLEHYSYDEVLEKAEELGYWLVVAGLLRGRLVSDVNPEIISRLRKHAKDIFEAMVEHAKKRLHDDPRMELNQLLITEPHLALNDILRDQKSTIEKTIMEVQDLMEKEQIDLNRRIYRFDLQNEMLNTQKIIDELSPLIEAFFKEHQKQSPQELIDNEMTRQQILEFKKAIETHDLHPSYFEHKTQLESVFDLATVFEQQHEGTRFESDQHQEEQDIFYDASDSFASESSTIEQQETHNSFYGALDSLASKRSTLEQENALSMNDDGDPYQEDQHDKFYDVSDTADHFEEVEIVQPQPSSPVIDNADNSPEELNKFQGLIDEINRYKKLRESEGHTHFVVPLFQYTKLDKMNAADHLIAALKNKDRVINDRDRAVLNNGLLSTAITSFLRKNKITITDGKPIKSVNELVNQLNQRQQPVGLLIKLLEDYRTQRKAKSEKYHFSFFPQYSKSDKLIAIDHFIAGLNGSEDDVEAKDIKALKQGSLGKLINNFLSANADALTKHFGKPITDIDDLITACSEKNRPSIN